MNILQINSSARNGANSTRVADSIVTKLKESNPTATLVLRNLATDPHPILDESALGALFTPADQRTPEQAARVALDDALIAEVQAADVIVLGIPMYNLGVPVQFKSWIDAIARAGVTFRYTEKGPRITSYNVCYTKLLRIFSWAAACAGNCAPAVLFPGNC